MENVIDLSPDLEDQLAPPAAKTPGVLTIAVSDCSGGAGLEADIKTITASHCYALDCITGLAAENSKGVYGLAPTETATVKQLLGTILDDDLNLKAVKVGLLPEENMDAVSDFFDKIPDIPVVLDPVLVANSGDSFGDSNTKKLISIFKKCRVITPNFVEAETLLSGVHESEQKISITVDPESLAVAAQEIGEKTGTSVLLKGGHIPFSEAGVFDVENPRYIYNVLYDDDTGETTSFKSNYIHSENTHGTGCTMSSRLAANLSKGFSLKSAVQDAIVFVNEAIRRSFPKKNGPVNHQWELAGGVNLLHDLVVAEKPAWDKFVSNPFWKALINGTLSESGLKHFLVQDYCYLQVYLACHKRLYELAPTLAAKEALAIAIKAVEYELSGHVKLLKTKFNIDDPTLIEPSQALTDYVAFMEALEKGDQFVDLQTALVPCQFGFNHAVAKFYKPDAYYDTSDSTVRNCSNAEKQECTSPYEFWLQDAVSPEYAEVLRIVQKHYNVAYNEQLDNGVADFEKQRQILNRGCVLEDEFWQECFDN